MMTPISVLRAPDKRSRTGIHTEVVAPANAALDVRMNAIAILAAELAVSNTDSVEMAEKIIDTIAFAAKSALPPGFAYKAQLSKRQ